MKTTNKSHTAAGSIQAEDIVNPLALATKLQTGDHPSAQYLLSQFSDATRGLLAGLPGSGADPVVLGLLLAKELSAVSACGRSLYHAVPQNGTPLRRSTKKLLKQNPQGAALERFNTLFIQDLFPEELEHASCHLVDKLEPRGVKFRIYCERRKGKRSWKDSYRITFPGPNGTLSTHARTLKEARDEIDHTLVDQVLAGRKPVTKKEAHNQVEKAAAYEELAPEAAKIGLTEPKAVVEFFKDAVKAQLKLGARPLLDFILYAVAIIAQPVVRCLFQAAVTNYEAFRMARNDIGASYNRKHVALAKKFAAAMPSLVHAQNTANMPPGTARPPCPVDVHVDEALPNVIQAWVFGLTVAWRRRCQMVDELRMFEAYCRDALHALPPGLPTPAQLVPRPKPASDFEPTPATVLEYLGVWRILVNIQDLQTLWFFSLGVFAGLHQAEILRLIWQHDIIWKGKRPKQVFIASGKGKDKHRGRRGAFVDIRYPLDEILALGWGRKGKIVGRSWTFKDKLMPLVRRLHIVWYPSIMRHTFCSDLFGIGLVIAEVARQMRDTVKTAETYYLAPIDELTAGRMWSLPMGIGRFKPLPLTKARWDWYCPLNEVRLTAKGKVEIAVDPGTAVARPNPKKRIKRQTPIAWPDDVELQVALWDESKSQAHIARELGCTQSAVSTHVHEHGLLVPRCDYLARVEHGLPVEIPDAVKQARAALAARKNGAAKPAGNSTPPPATPSANGDNDQTPAP